jgi:8-oxo-dGTP pyrophosphatase MutT (NUDIX family)
MLPIEQCYGVIVVLREEQDKFLILEHNDTKDDNWSFAKGHTEEGETPIVTAMRELKEETGIEEIKILDIPLIHEEYEIFRHGENRLKVNEYFIGIVTNNKVKIDGDEICAYKWVTYEEAINTFTHEERKQALYDAQKYLENMVK